MQQDTGLLEGNWLPGKWEPGPWSPTAMARTRGQLRRSWPLSQPVLFFSTMIPRQAKGGTSLASGTGPRAGKCPGWGF